MNPRARAIREMTERPSRDAFPRLQMALVGVAMSALAPDAQAARR